jgi:hypothetical protein
MVNNLLVNKDYFYAIVIVKTPRSGVHAVFRIAQHPLTNAPISHNARTFNPKQKQKHSIIKINPKALPDLVTIPVKDQRRRRNNHRQESKNRDSPTIAQLLEHRWRKQRRHTAQDTTESRTSSDGAGGVLLEAVDVVVLASVEDHDLADAVEVGGGDGREPVRMQLDRPCEPEEGDGDEHSADVG